MGTYERFGYSDDWQAQGEQIDAEYKAGYERAILDLVGEFREYGELAPVAIAGKEIYHQVKTDLEEGNRGPLADLCFLYAAGLDRAAKLHLAVIRMAEKQQEDPEFDAHIKGVTAGLRPGGELADLDFPTPDISDLDDVG